MLDWAAHFFENLIGIGLGRPSDRFIHDFGEGVLPEQHSRQITKRAGQFAKDVSRPR